MTNQEQDVYRKLNDAEVSSILLTSPQGGEVEVKDLAVSLSIFEDLFSASGSLSGYIYISDSINLISHLPIIGGESVSIVFRTPGIGTEYITVKLMVVAIQERTRSTSERSELYKLVLASEHIVQSGLQRVSKVYKGKTSDIFINVITDYFSEDTKYLVEETKEDMKLVVPNMEPVTVLNWLCSMSTSSTSPHNANYVFYQSIDHLNFLSLGSLSQATTSKAYKLTPTGIRTESSTLLDQFNNIQDFKISRDFHRLKDVTSGVYSSRLYTHDITTKQINVSAFNYGSGFYGSDHVHENPTLAKQSPFTAFQDGPTFFRPLQTQAFEDYPEFYNPHEHVLKRKSSTRSYSQKGLTIRVAGDSSLRAGMIVDITVTSNEPLESTDTEFFDKYMSGRYMIGSVRHSIDLSSGVEYTCILDLMSDSHVTRIPDQKTMLGTSKSSSDTQLLQDT